MKATVRFADGTRAVCAITNIENDGSGAYGYALRGKEKIPVSQSTTIHNADGTVTKEWDEIVQGWGPQLGPGERFAVPFDPGYEPVEENW